MEKERNGNIATIALKDSLLAKKDGEIKKLKAKLTQLQTKHKAKRCEQADIINCKTDSIKEQKFMYKKNICEMDDWMAEVNEERELAVSLLIKSKEKLLASKNAANALKVKLNRKEDKLLEHQRLSATLQRRFEQRERSLVELDMEKSEYIAELEHDCAQAIEEFNVSTCYMASSNLHSMRSKSCLYQFSLRPRTIKKVWVKNIDSKGGTRVWHEWFVQMVLEMLLHCTPPSCIPPVILTVVDSLYNDPTGNAIRQLPSEQTVWEWRSVLVVVTKMLAAYQLGKVDSYEQLFTGGTSWRQTAIQNAVVGILTDSGFKMVTLSSGIPAENETAKCLTGSIIRTFKEGGQLLNDWRIVLERLYPSRQDLLDMIPQSQALTLDKLANDGMVSTDTCNTARKTRRLLCKAIRMVAIEQGLREESINIMENDCWNHLRNV